ncbi:hypothetical protein LTR17_017882 [Elasticomyces elasticus]|nr:hypothetical protein LTR17_017882 [Elasticomyces elasticus]
MRLINIHTLGFEEYAGDEVPEYAILSHRWNRKEITFAQYFKDGTEAGYGKIWDFCGATRRYNKYLEAAKLEARAEQPAIWALLDIGACWNGTALYRHQQHQPGDEIAAVVDPDQRPIVSARGQPLIDDVPLFDEHQFKDTWLWHERLSRVTLLSYIWIDTCCIDKHSSAELSEAINSMYDWYHRARICFVYLSDVSWSGASCGNGGKVGETAIVPWLLEDFRKSEWFSRGWTLQEMLASKCLIFCQSDWSFFAHRCLHTTGDRSTTLGEGDHHGKDCEWLPPTTDIHSQLSETTGIHREFFGSRAASAAQVFSWMAKRRTTRPEDIAYCLLGLLDINMPLLYGEGTRAFRRLQEEVVRSKGDHTVFAFHSPNPGLFAPSPSEFIHSSNVTRRSRRPQDMILGSGVLSLTAKAVRLEPPKAKQFIEEEWWLLPLDIDYSPTAPTNHSLSRPFAIIIFRPKTSRIYHRIGQEPVAYRVKGFATAMYMGGGEKTEDLKVKLPWWAQVPGPTTEVERTFVISLYNHFDARRLEELTVVPGAGWA